MAIRSIVFLLRAVKKMSEGRGSNETIGDDFLVSNERLSGNSPEMWPDQNFCKLSRILDLQLTLLLLFIVVLVAKRAVALF